MTLWRERVANLCGCTAAMFVLAMMLITVTDIVLRAVANQPLRGILELVELLLACSFFIALPAIFLRDEHIVVNIVDTMAPRWVPLLKRIASVSAVVVLVVMAWQSWIVAKDAVLFGDVTSDLSIPRLYYWIPVLTGIIGGALAALVMAVFGDGDDNRDRGKADP